MPRRKQEQDRDKTRKDEIIRIRVTVALKERLQRKAIKHGKSLTAYITDILKGHSSEPDSPEQVRKDALERKLELHGALQYALRMGLITNEEYDRRQNESEAEYSQIVKETLIENKD
ncbi:MAG: hypothetical protein AB9903_12935 [Vulcanimicrobiota bacterium]